MTDRLIPGYRAMVQANSTNFNGLSILQHTKQIGRLARLVGAKTMLDFGCGRGDAYRSPYKVHHQWGISRSDVTLYDPAFNRGCNLPRGRYDLVVCSDVLEHIPEDEVDAFVQRLFSYAKHAVWASVCCREAKKFFLDGVTNLHVTVRPRGWWLDTLAKHANGTPFELAETL
jgi:2-polyprenyl-3-methyl-5-hydroxy-6-metoxy-1,4-benzoquinol methylase